MPPYPRSISEVAKEEGITEATLYNWRKALREKGPPCLVRKHRQNNGQHKRSSQSLLKLTR
ncbi:helix-turn-helix domain-containing protein (plasmid) [Vibrio alginolyticus]